MIGAHAQVVQRPREARARRLTRSVSGRIGLALVSALVLFALVGPWAAGRDPYASDFVRGVTEAQTPAPPSREFLLGADRLFRDELSRLAHGARLSLAVALAATLIASTLGATVGIVAGWYEGRWVDTALMRVVDVGLAFPFLLLVMAVGAALDRTTALSLLAVLGLTGWFGTARLLRAKTLEVRALDFIAASRALGQTTPRMLALHVLPNVSGPLIITTTISVGQMIVAESVLSYLGVGIAPPTPTWGRMLFEGQDYWAAAPWLLLAPGAAILVSVLGFNLLGEGLRDALDPKGAERALVAAAAVAALAPLPSCRTRLAAPLPAASPDDAPPRRGGTLRLAAFADIRSLDPAVSSEALGASIMQHVIAGLIDYDEAGHVIDDLAARHELADGGRVVRFFLREGVRFHDGEELIAEDVKRSAERALHPTTPNPFRSSYDNVVGAVAFGKGKAPHLEGVRVEGRYVVAFVLERPDATFLPMLGQATLRPVCRSAGERYVAGWHPCGAGPFKLLPGDWERGRSITLVRHDGYFRPGLPYLDAVTWSLLAPLGAQRFKLEDGDLDVLRDVNQSDMMAFVGDPRWAKYGRFEAEREVWGENMNVEMAPFDNIEVRRAVAAAIDRRKYRLMKPGMVREATQLLPPDVPMFDASLPGQQRYDLAAAKEHMRRAGLEHGWPEPIPYYVYPQGFAEHAVQVLQQELSPLGLRLDVRLVNYPAFLAITRRRGRAPMSPQGWQQDFPDPSTFFEAVFHSRSIDDEDSNNTAFYRNARLDGVLDRAHGSTDAAERKRLYDEAGRVVCDEAPWAFTHYSRRWEVRQPYVRGWARHAVWPQLASRAWLDRAPTAGRVALGPKLAPEGAR